MNKDYYYTEEELLDFGFSSVGKDVRISRKCSLYAISGSVGNHVRIDDFCILKGHLEIGTHIHIASFCSFGGSRGTIRLGDFCSMGNRVSVYTGSDNFKADALNSSTVPQEFVNTITGDVRIGRGVLIGAHTVVLPGVTIGDGAAVGAQCVIFQPVAEGSMVISASSRTLDVGKRNVRRILQLADEVLELEQRRARDETNA